MARALATLLVALSLAVVAAGDDLERLSWLTGTWRAEIAGTIIEESWTDNAGGLMLGVSRSVAGGKATGFEFLRIEMRDDAVVYVAQPNGAPGTDFVLSELEGLSAVFENPAHDHPKVLGYRVTEDGVLHVRIDGDEGLLELEFQRVDDP